MQISRAVPFVFASQKLSDIAPFTRQKLALYTSILVPRSHFAEILRMCLCFPYRLYTRIHVYNFTSSQRARITVMGRQAPALWIWLCQMFRVHRVHVMIWLPIWTQRAVGAHNCEPREHHNYAKRIISCRKAIIVARALSRSRARAYVQPQQKSKKRIVTYVNWNFWKLVL